MKKTKVFIRNNEERKELQTFKGDVSVIVGKTELTILEHDNNDKLKEYHFKLNESDVVTINNWGY